MRRLIAAGAAGTLALSIAIGAIPVRAANYANWANSTIYNGAYDPTQRLMSWWGMDHAIVSAGIHAIIAYVQAGDQALQGKLAPVASYVVSPAITAQTQDHFVNELAGSSSSAADHENATEYVKSRFADYVSDADAQHEAPANLVTACAYFAATAVMIEDARDLTSAERRALRGGCVVVLAGREAGLGQFGSEKERQSTAEILMLVAGMARDEYANAKAPERVAKLRANMEARFKEYFDVPLRSFPIDNIACAGVTDAADLRECRAIPNSRLEAIADNTK
jgi:hypothetical protein